MGGCLCCHFKRCSLVRWSRKHPQRQHDVTQEDASGVFQAYQAFMGNIQTVSTLLLGFLITGTLLSVMLTGLENYGADKVYLFTTQAVLSVAFSGTSMLLGFVIQARGTSAYENFGAVRAVKSMRRSQLCICIAESCIYWSLIFFMWSLKDYVMMNYVGPDICPYTQRDLPSTESFCSQLGVDFYYAMRLRCSHGGDPDEDPALEERRKSRQARRWSASSSSSGGNPANFSDANSTQLQELNLRLQNETITRRKRVDNDFVCNQYSLLGSEHGMRRKYIGDVEPMNFAVWDCLVYRYHNETLAVDTDCESPDHLQLINDVSEVYCSVRKMTELRMELCGPDFLEDDNGIRCAEAYSAYRKAQECVDNSLEDARRCYQVCQWNRDQSPRMRLQASIGRIIGIASGVIMTIFSLRLLRGLQQTCIVFATDNAHPSKQLLHQAFIRDPESSEDDDEETQVKDPSRTSRAEADTTDGPSPLNTRGMHVYDQRQMELIPDPYSMSLGRGWHPNSSALSTQTTQLPSTSCQMSTLPQSNRQLGTEREMQPRGWGRSTGTGASMVQGRLDNWRAAQSRDPNQEASSARGFTLW